MINAVPFAVAVWAMFITQDKQWSNQTAVSLFCAFYCVALSINHIFANDPAYFVWNIASSPVFIACLLMLNRFTMMMLLLCLTEAALAIIDSVGFLTYNLGLEDAFVMRVTPEKIVIALQLAALMVKDGRPVNVSTVWDDLVKLVRNSAAYFACIEAFQDRRSTIQAA